jgi:hypothetical protein
MSQTIGFRTLSTSVAAIAIAAVVLGSIAGLGLAFQAGGTAAGHWTGTITGPELAVEVDLAPKGADAWHGTISIPSQGTKGIPLSEVSVKGTAVTFAIPGAPGNPRYAGTLSADGKTITGDFMQSGATLVLTLTRQGEPKFEVPQKSTPITKELEGSWEGSLDVKGQILRLVLKLANGANGATGVLVSLDQNSVEIPVATVTQQGSRLTLLVTMIGGTFDGELKGGELAGTWTQGPLNLPLVFKSRQQE